MVMPFLNVSGVYGGLFETGILILRHDVAPLLSHQLIKAKQQLKMINGRYSSPSGPMTMTSGVLESP
jgi:hypothetical protein